MGRKSLDNKATLVRLSDEARARISEYVGQYGLAAFIREAVEKELERREKSKSS